jgi:hypothetical protein
MFFIATSSIAADAAGGSADDDRRYAAAAALGIQCCSLPDGTIVISFLQRRHGHGPDWDTALPPR